MPFQIMDNCIACGVCEAECLYGAIHITGADGYAIDPRLCQCAVGVDPLRCRQACPVDAIQPVQPAGSQRISRAARA